MKAVLKKNQIKMPEMKNTVIEIKIVVDSLISRPNRARERINDLENMSTESKEKKVKNKTKHSIQEL